MLLSAATAWRCGGCCCSGKVLRFGDWTDETSSGSMGIGDSPAMKLLLFPANEFGEKVPLLNCGLRGAATVGARKKDEVEADFCTGEAT